MSAEKVIATYQQIEQQYQSGHNNATVLVRRSKGKGISTGTYLGESKERPGLYEVGVDTGTRYVTADSLTDAGQAELAEQLAGTTVIKGLGDGAIKQMELNGYAERIDDGIKPEVLRSLREQVIASDNFVESPAVAEAEATPDGFTGFKENLVDYADRLIGNPKTDPHTSAALLSGMISGRQYDSKFTPEQRAGLKRVADYLFSASMEGSAPGARYATHKQVVGPARDMLKDL